MQFILAPPFAWRWNRATASPQVPTFFTEIGKTDYSVALSNFGWMEKAVCYDPDNGYSAQELQIGLLFGADTLPNQPTRIAAQFDDDAGNVTFRVFPAPDKVYAVVVEHQKAAPQFTLLTQTWSPVPDYLSYLFNQGFQAKAYEYLSDPRFQASMEIFFQNLAANSEGLTESQKNLWLTDKLNTLRQTQAVQSGRR